MEIITLIAPIILEGMKFLNNERKNKLENEYFNVIESLRRAENAKGAYYFDSEIDLKQERFNDFLIAYGHLFKEQANETSA